MKKKFDAIENAIKAIRNGELIIVVDDESRENEGDFICASEKVTPEIINFMSKEGRGLICCSLEEDRCESLGLNLMVGKNTDKYSTSFTVSVDLKGEDVTTGISGVPVNDNDPFTIRSCGKAFKFTGKSSTEKFLNPALTFSISILAAPERIKALSFKETLPRS